MYLPLRNVGSKHFESSMRLRFFSSCCPRLPAPVSSSSSAAAAARLVHRVDKNSGQACYALLDKGGLPLPHFQGGLPFPGAANPAPCMPMPVAPMAMTPVMGAMPMCVPPAAPACPPAATTVAIVGDTVKPDKWTEYKDDKGTPYYHNPKKKETTWEKPKDFDKQKNAGKPPPPDKPKKEKKSPKYK